MVEQVLTIVIFSFSGTLLPPEKRELLGVLNLLKRRHTEGNEKCQLYGITVGRNRSSLLHGKKIVPVWTREELKKQQWAPPTLLLEH